MNTQQNLLKTGDADKASSRKSAKRGFTLIEMIGVLAIIAILAVVIVPKVFDAIRSSRINSALVSMGTFKTATADFVAKYGTLPTTGSKSRFDDLLIEAGLMDERFSAKIGVQADIYATAGATWTRSSSGVWSSSGGSNQESLNRIICQTSDTTSPSTAKGKNFRLNGTDNMPSGARIVAAAFEAVPIAEARELSKRVDGDELSTNAISDPDNRGKVAYKAPSNGVTDVYVYIIHQ